MIHHDCGAQSWLPVLAPVVVVIIREVEEAEEVRATTREWLAV